MGEPLSLNPHAVRNVCRMAEDREEVRMFAEELSEIDRLARPGSCFYIGIDGALEIEKVRVGSLQSQLYLLAEFGQEEFNECF